MMYNEPGFLIPTLFPDIMETSMRSEALPQRYCVIPHVRDFFDSPQIQELKGISARSTKVLIVSPLNNWESLVRKIASECNYVASSSLYGLIMAEAMGIPTLWFQEKNRIIARTEGTFKYNDFYDGIDMEEVTPFLEWLGINIVANSKSYREAIPIKRREQYSKTIMASFPYDLFYAKCR
jgi:pyruvyltransferase